uniref:Exonuclease domain-containing protein n=1 Tax=Caenorhabditis japonica TaxID=281687 RepID=A0A8R1DXL4_CAEJA
MVNPHFAVSVMNYGVVFPSHSMPVSPVAYFNPSALPPTLPVNVYPANPATYYPEPYHMKPHGPNWCRSSNRDFFIRKLCLSRKEMLAQGFPVRMFNEVHIKPNKYQENRVMFCEKEDLNRVCIRCHCEYTVGSDGLQVKSETAICGENNFHITDQQRAENLKKFENTPEVSKFNAHVSDKLFAMDVEMVYTALGQEVGRVTMVSESGESVVDVLVRPSTEVFDPVTKFSGLTKQDVESATMTLESVRKFIFTFLNEKSVLVGHGLFGDLKALGIVHDRVIDTSVIYTNNGRRPSLRHLTAFHLGYEIQQSSSGHCSFEDAIAALQLVYFGIENPRALTAEFCNLLASQMAMF